MTTQLETKRIASLKITIDGSDYFYEAHSYNRVAEILAGQLEVLDTGRENDWGGKIYSSNIESFEIIYFE